jgi:hypothetical protein
MKNVLILVLTSSRWPFSMMEECIRNTWGKYEHPNIRIYYNHAYESIITSNKTQLEGDIIRAPHIESFHGIGNKTISAFEYFLLNEEFDYVFRPNSSSFVNIPKLLEFLDTAPLMNYYSGSPLWFNSGGVTEEDKINGPEQCCSGCGYILSRDLVELIVHKQDMWQHRMIDDMALCKFLKDHGVNAVESPRIPAHYLKDGNVYSFDKALTNDEILDQFHITLRAPEIVPQIENAREHNCEIMKTLYNKVYEN